MAPPRKLLNLYVAEVYRYRLAMDDQMQRVQLATESLKRKPDTDVLARLVDSNTPEKWRALSEAQFLFGAVRGICYMADAMQTTAERDQFLNLVSRVGAAKEDFDASAPHAVNMRDFLTHLDRYMAGGGFKQLPQPELRVWLATPGEDLGLCVGGVVVSVAQTVEAATNLAIALQDALRELEADERET